MNQQNTNYPIDYIDIRTIFATWFEKKWIIISISLCFLMVSMIFVNLRPEEYQATTLLLIQKNPLQNSSQSSEHRSFNLAMVPEELISTKIALLRSTYVLNPVIKSLGLDFSVKEDETLSTNKSFDSNSEKIKINEFIVPKSYLNKPLSLIIDSNNQYRLYHKKSLLIDGIIGQKENHVGITLSLDNINATAKETFTIIKYSEFEIYEKLRKKLIIINLSGDSLNHGNESDILQIKLNGNNPKVISDILNQITHVYQIKNMDRKKNQVEKTLEFLHQQTRTTKESVRHIEQDLNRYQSMHGKIDIKLQTEYLMSHIADIDKKIEEVYLKKTNISEQYTDIHPYIIALNDKIHELTKRRKILFDEIKRLPEENQVAISMQREINIKNNLYINLLRQIQDLEVLNTNIINDIQILSPATVPEISLTKKLLLVAVSSTMIGLIIGCIFVLLWKIFLRKIDDPYWVEKTWGIRNLSIIPYSKQEEKNNKAYKRKKINKLPLLAHQSPHDITLDPLTALRTYLQLQSIDSQNNIICIMGLSKGVGKAFIAANLASLFARVSQNVLLIDTDFKNSHLHDYFTSQKPLGLTNILHGETALQNVLIPSKEFSTLSFLGAGTHLEKTTDLFIHEQFKLLLSNLKKSYQYTIINASSDALSTDNIVLGREAETNLLLMGSNKHATHDVNTVIKQFKHAGINLYGVIYNHLNAYKHSGYTRILFKKSPLIYPTS